MSSPTLLLAFFRKEAVEYLARLEHLATVATDAPPDRTTVLAQARALHGSARITPLEGMVEATAALERLAGGLHEGAVHWDASLRLRFLEAVRGVRALVAQAEQWGPEAQREAHAVVVRLSHATVQALAGPQPTTAEAGRVVPIARFYPEDGAPGILHRAPAPATTVARRFRDAMAAVGARAGAEAARVLQDAEETRRALHELADVAESYGAASVAQLATRMARAPLTSPEEREAVLALAALLQDRTLTEPQLAQAVREAGARFGSRLEAPPPADIVPIETLLYRGHAALARARTVRDALQGHWQRGTLAEPAAHALFEELSELLDLAGTP
jgi:chemotaxis protein histidine kinase CheA